MKLQEITTNEFFTVDMMYAGVNNMLRTNIYERVGLGNRCFVCDDMYACLQRLAPMLRQRGLKLKICDAYRPPLAHRLMKEIIPMSGFFAAEPEKSQHCHASAVDVSLINAATGQELDFPCKVDAYTPYFAEEVTNGRWDEFRTHLEKAQYSWIGSSPQDAALIANRSLLRDLMEQAGLQALEHEWWHFNLPDKDKYPMVDFGLVDGQFCFSAQK